MKILGRPLFWSIAIGLATILAGCETFFPNMEGPLGVGSWVHHIPVKKAVQQIQCELSDFIRESKAHDKILLAERSVPLSQSDNSIKYSPVLLDKSNSKTKITGEGRKAAELCDRQGGKMVRASEISQKKYIISPDPKHKSETICFDADPVYADVSLYLQQDTMGNVNYIGIDLNKLGLEPLAELIAVSNKIPSLSIAGQATATVKSQLDLQIPQEDRHLDSHFGLGVPCSGGTGSVIDRGSNLISSLGLKAHLENFFKRYNEDAEDQNSKVCMTKLTIQTQFVILVDAKAGVNPLFGASYILPISGLNIQIQPKFTHALQITLYLEPEDRLCPSPKASVAPVPRL